VPTLRGQGLSTLVAPSPDGSMSTCGVPNCVILRHIWFYSNDVCEIGICCKNSDIGVVCATQQSLDEQVSSSYQWQVELKVPPPPHTENVSTALSWRSENRSQLWK